MSISCRVYCCCVLFQPTAIIFSLHYKSHKAGTRSSVQINLRISGVSSICYICINTPVCWLKPMVVWRDLTRSWNSGLPCTVESTILFATFRIVLETVHGSPLVANEIELVLLSTCTLITCPRLKVQWMENFIILDWDEISQYEIC